MLSDNTLVKVTISCFSCPVTHLEQTLLDEKSRDGSEDISEDRNDDKEMDLKIYLRIEMMI